MLHLLIQLLLLRRQILVNHFIVFGHQIRFILLVLDHLELLHKLQLLLSSVLLVDDHFHLRDGWFLFGRV